MLLHCGGEGRHEISGLTGKVNELSTLLAGRKSDKTVIAVADVAAAELLYLEFTPENDTVLASSRQLAYVSTGAVAMSVPTCPTSALFRVVRTYSSELHYLSYLCSFTS